MGILAFIVLGLLAGIIVKKIMGGGPDGLILTCVLGIVGALLGGWLAAVIFDKHPLDEFFDISTWITAIIGSMILIFAFRLVSNRA